MSMCKKLYVMFFIVVALALSVFVTIWPHQRMHEIVMVTRFFEVMLPVLAAGALIKYLCCGASCCYKKKDSAHMD